MVVPVSWVPHAHCPRLVDARSFGLIKVCIDQNNITDGLWLLHGNDVVSYFREEDMEPCLAHGWIRCASIRATSMMICSCVLLCLVALCWVMGSGVDVWHTCILEFSGLSC